MKEKERYRDVKSVLSGWSVEQSFVRQWGEIAFLISLGMNFV
jgi:hypothetical protein